MMPVPWEYLQENLVTQAEIARRLNLARTAVTTWAKLDDWPAPVMTFGSHSGTGEFYWWPDIQAWRDRHDVTIGRKTPTRPDEDLVSRTEIAARRGVHIGTVMTWIDRYDDFPKPARPADSPPRWSWPDVRDYLDRKGLPRMRRSPSEKAAAARDTRIKAALELYPGGLTTPELAELTREDEPDAPSDHAVSVRIEDRMLRMQAAGLVTRVVRPGDRRGVRAWKLTPPDPLSPAVSTG